MQDSTTAVADAFGTPEFFPFTITDAVEIVAILTGLRDRRVRARAYFNAQSGSILTSLLAVNATARTFVFDIDSDKRRNDAIVAAGRLAWQTAIDGVRIEFNTESARMIAFDDGPALEAPIPARVLRLQRRNAFRAPVPAGRPLACLIYADGSDKLTFKAPVLDISALGVSLLIDTAAMPVTPVQPVSMLSIDLPGFGEVQCAADIRYAIDAGRRYPAHFRRCGVQFKTLAAADQVLVQRYIMTLERERAKSRLVD